MYKVTTEIVPLSDELIEAGGKEDDDRKFFQVSAACTRTDSIDNLKTQIYDAVNTFFAKNPDVISEIFPPSQK